VDDSSVVTHCRVADVSWSLLLVVATDKGARQPTVLLLDVEGEGGGTSKRGKKRNKIYMLVTALIEPRPNIHSHYTLSLSLFILYSHVCDILYIFLLLLSPISRIYPTSISDSNFFHSYSLPKPC
jgi:hypothetical protein